MDFLSLSREGAADVAEAITLLIVSGLLMRFSLTLTGQVWAKTYQQTMAFIILPVITYVITKTITGNVSIVHDTFTLTTQGKTVTIKL